LVAAYPPVRLARPVLADKDRTRHDRAGNRMATYQEIRGAAKALHTKILDTTKHLGFNPLCIAKRMTLPMEDSVPGLMQAYRQKMKRVLAAELPEKRFVFLFQKHRQCGADQRWEDVA
jgi:hypothetical protein